MFVLLMSWSALSSIPLPATATDLDSVDVAVFDIRFPRYRVDSLTHVVPAAAVINLGTGWCSFAAFCRIESAGVAVYGATLPACYAGARESLALQFDTWPMPHPPGDYVIRCSLYSAADSRTWNNTLSHNFYVEPVHPAHEPPMWRSRSPMPGEPSGKQETEGGWLVYCAASQLLYAAKGGKQGDFYSYAPATDSWRLLAPIPPGRENKLSGKGAVAACDGDRYVYAVKGNNTLGFFRYDIASDTWRQLADVPRGVYASKVKGASDMTFFKRSGRDSGCVYLLKGRFADLYRYWPEGDSWQGLGYIPMVEDPLTYDGTWIAAHVVPNLDYYRIYAHKGKWHTFWWFDAWADTWQRSEYPTMPGMPFVNSLGKTKASKKGGCAVWHDNRIFALKGNNTQEFWCFRPPQLWFEWDTIPRVGTGDRKKKVKGGADIASAGEELYALKGGKCNELWLYDWEYRWCWSLAPGGPAGAGLKQTGRAVLSILPNPTASGTVTARYVLPAPQPALLSVVDIAGRTVASRRVMHRNGTVELDLRRLSAGVYSVTLDARGGGASRRLVLVR